MQTESSERWIAGLAHLAYLPVITTCWLPLLFYFWKHDESDFVAEHARQAAAYQAVVAVFLAVSGGVVYALRNQFSAFMLHAIVLLLVVIFALILLVLAVPTFGGAAAAARGDEYLYPFLGPLLDG